MPNFCLIFIATSATRIFKSVIKEISQDQEQENMLLIKTLKKEFKIDKNELFPLCVNYNEAADQLSKLNRGIQTDSTFDIQYKIQPNVFYANRGKSLEKKMKAYQLDKDIEFQANDDIYELVLLDSKNDKNVYMLTFHNSQDCEVDGIKLGELIKKNGHAFDTKE